MADARTPRKIWLLCILLFAATTLNYLDRQTLSILAPTMQKEMQLDNAALGWLFSVFYYTRWLSSRSAYSSTAPTCAGHSRRRYWLGRWWRG